jgi:hypothetical protein
MPDDLDERENEPPEGLMEADRSMLIFSLQRTYEQLREEEGLQAQHVERVKEQVKEAQAGHGDQKGFDHLVDDLSMNAKLLGHLQWAIDKFEELNYRFPFIQGAEFFAEADT